MEDQKYRGLVMKEMTVGENDKRLTLFVKGKGKVVAFAKGARKQKSPLLASTQVMSYGDFIIQQKSSYTMVKQGELIEFFPNIRQDVFQVAYAMYMMELLDYVVFEDQEQDALLLLTLKTLKRLEKGNLPVKLLTHVFELKVLSLSGYAPEVSCCASCGKKEGPFHFSVSRGGILCSQCHGQGKYGRSISEGTLNTLRHILYAPLDQLYGFNVSELVFLELDQITKQFIGFHLGKQFKTLDFIKDLESFNG